jgi:hypothetical protein
MAMTVAIDCIRSLRRTLNCHVVDVDAGLHESR